MNKTSKSQQGFTLIEIGLALLIVTFIAAFTSKALLFERKFAREEAQAEKTIEEIKQISDAAGAWHLDVGDWPDFANDCEGAILELTKPTDSNNKVHLLFIDVTSPYDTDYVTSCEKNYFNIEVKSTEGYAQYITVNLANTTLKSEDPPENHITITSIPRESIVKSLGDFLPLTGGEMSGGIEMGGNQITGASDVASDDGRTLIKIETIQPGDDVDKPNCPQGKEPRINVSPISRVLESRKLAFALPPTITVNSSTWTVEMQAFDEDGGDKLWDLTDSGTFIEVKTHCETP